MAHENASDSSSRREFIKTSAIVAASAAFLKKFTDPAHGADAPADAPVAPEVKAAKEKSGMNTADVLVDKLVAWDVSLVFAVIGDGVNHITEALRKRKDKIRLITTRHEEAAAFMASGYAKYTGRLGVCMGTTGPGAVHLMNGIYDAAMEGAPVLAITGSVNHDLTGTSFTQEVNTLALMKDATVYNQLITGPQHARTVVDLACRIAATTPGVSHLTLAKDTQNLSAERDKPSKEGESLDGSSKLTPRIEIPDDDELNAAAALLKSGGKIAILVGRGALNASSEVEALAEKLGAPVAKALLGKAVLPDDSKYTTGGIGHLGTLPSLQSMQDCDRLLILGSNMPHLEYYPKLKEVKAIQIDRDPKRLGLRFPIEMGLSGDIKATLKLLLQKLDYKADRSFLTLAQKRMADWRDTMSRIEANQSAPIKPQFLAAKVSELLSDNAMISIDTGAHTQFSARHLKIRRGQSVVVCGNLASMAPALPYAIAAQLAFPNRQSVALTGDGGFTMLMGEVATAVRYNLPIKVIIFKNNSLSMDRFEQEEMGYEPYGDTLQPIDFAKIAEAMGAEGYSCAQPAELAGTLKRAFATQRPAVVEVDVDTNEPPLPPEKVK